MDIANSIKGNVKMAPTSFVQRSYRDWSGEVSSFDVTTYLITAGNIANHQSHQTALDSAIAALTNGILAKTGYGTREMTSNDNGPFGSYRENKLLVTYKANSSEKLFRSEIPCPDLVEGNFLANTDELDLADTAVAALVTAWEDLVRSPDNGTEACTVQSIRFVGRNI